MGDAPRRKGKAIQRSMGVLGRLGCLVCGKSKRKGKARRVEDARDDGGGGGRSLLLSIGSDSDTKMSKQITEVSSNPSNLDGSPRENPFTDDNDSIPTMDSDYNKVRSGGCSLSDAGGTVGTQNRCSLTGFSQADTAFGSGAPSGFGGYDGHLIQSPVRRASEREEMIEIVAPGGKLGLVIDHPPDRDTPVVHAIKDTCPVRGEIRVGDKLVAVDDDDVRAMSAVEVSRLISRKSRQGSRRLTIIRAVRGTNAI